MLVPEKRQLVLHSANAATPAHDVHIEGEKTQQKAIQRCVHLSATNRSGMIS